MRRHMWIASLVAVVLLVACGGGDEFQLGAGSTDGPGQDAPSADDALEPDAQPEAGPADADGGLEAQDKDAEVGLDAQPEAEPADADGGLEAQDKDAEVGLDAQPEAGPADAGLPVVGEACSSACSGARCEQGTCEACSVPLCHQGAPGTNCGGSTYWCQYTPTYVIPPSDLGCVDWGPLVEESPGVYVTAWCCTGTCE